MDKVTKNNQQKWDQLVRLEVPCSRPFQDINPKTAKERFNPDNIFGDVKGKKVLCLASGGRQQSIGFAMMGALVTVVDFSQEQLKKDELEANKHLLTIRILQSDMRDLSVLKTDEFDIVYQPYSINYVPEVQAVFDEVSRVLKPGGIYYLMFHNPFVQGSWKDAFTGNPWSKEELWHEKGYPITLPYKDGLPITVSDPSWNFKNSKGKTVKAAAAQEFKHTLSTIINSLIQRKFSILKFEEFTNDRSNSTPGTWEHYVSVAAPWFYLWVKKIV